VAATSTWDGTSFSPLIIRIDETSFISPSKNGRPATSGHDVLRPEMSLTINGNSPAAALKETARIIIESSFLI
ncbi:MAG TPA: hypothetical protein PKN36_07795, partial [bacterium]|nr:hypothetical protein [bacterium]